MKEGSTSKNHGKFTRVIGVVEPVLVVSVPRVESTGKSNYPIPCFSPYPRYKNDHFSILFDWCITNEIRRHFTENEGGVVRARASGGREVSSAEGILPQIYTKLPNDSL